MKSLRVPISFLFTVSQKIAAWSGAAAALLSILLVAVIVSDVALRYLVGETSVWIVEVEWHIFALIFLLGAAYTLRRDAHVRVDVFFQMLSQRGRSWLNLMGHLLLLIPFCLFIIPPAWDYFLQSWIVSEASGDPGGLPALYPIKAFIPMAFLLLLIQAGTEVVRLFLDLFFPEFLPNS